MPLHTVNSGAGRRRGANPLRVPLFRDLSRILGQISKPVGQALLKYVNLHQGFLLSLGEELAFYVGAFFLLGFVGGTTGADAFLNPYAGREERVEAFEFASKPAVARRSGKVVIRFAAKHACDATVAIVDAKGKVVRHLGSGVLGRNAPWPFEQDSLSQSIDWDGKDDWGRAAPWGCRARVSLGLKARLDNILGWGPGH